MQFDVLWKAKLIVSYTHHFDAPAGFDAVKFEADAMGDAVPAASGDPLTLRFTVSNAVAGPAFIPNADGSHTNGRIPSLTLP